MAASIYSSDGFLPGDANPEMPELEAGAQGLDYRGPTSRCNLNRKHRFPCRISRLLVGHCSPDQVMSLHH